MLNQLTVVSKSIFLSNYPIEHIDEYSLTFIKRHLGSIKRGRDVDGPLINLLNCHLGLQNKKIFRQNIFQDDLSFVFSTLIHSIESGKIIKLHGSYNHITALKRLLLSIGNEIKSTECIVRDVINTDYHYENDIVDYYKGWFAFDKKSKRKFLKLHCIFNMFGKDAARIIERNINFLTQGNLTLNTSVPMLNWYFEFLKNSESFTKEFKYSQELVDESLRECCRLFFKHSENKGLCIKTSIKRWNDSKVYFQKSLFESPFFAEPFLFPYIPPNRKTGAETRLKSNSDDLLIKEKAITDIPLDTTDDEAIKLLFGKIDEDVKFVLNWAKYKASELFERYSENIDVIDYRDFEIGSRLIEKKYNISRSSGDSLTSFAHKVGIPTSYSLDAFKYLLIDQHPEITQSFLSNLKMFNSKWHKIGVVQSDNSFYLIGEKNRKGKKTGQQKVKLTEKSLLLVEQIIQITKPLRLYLEFKNNSDFQYLFLSTNRAFHGVGRAKDRDPKDVRKKPSHRQFVEDFSSLNDISLQDATALCSKLSLTRFRGSKGIQVYIETTSVKSMSKALGHEKYKQSLLSHYLPEPIIRFFKERWVRIFQKGIVCESMKSSSHLLKASSFKSIKELDNFLRLHALKIIPAKESRQSKLNGEKIYETAIIYLNPEVLTILLSFELAVENIKKPSPYICYWAKFSHALKKEINERIRDPEFLDMLSIAENKAHISLLGDLINE